MRIPLEYLPSSKEGRDQMLGKIGPGNGWTISLGPKNDTSLLAYSTESLMRVWAIATILPEGLTPDSLLVNEPIGSPASPRYKTIDSQPNDTAWQHDIPFLDWELNPEFTDDEFTLTFPDGIFVMDETKTTETPTP